MEYIQVKELKKGYGINHVKHGYLQYRGLVTRHNFTDEPKVPHQYLFWKCADVEGNDQSDVILSDGNLLVQVVDKIEDYE